MPLFFDTVDTTDAEIKATGALKLKESVLYRLLHTNRTSLRLLIWGKRAGPVTPHNHGHLGGSLLLRPLLHWGLGPHFREGSGLAPSLGIPLGPPQAGVSMATSPKLIAAGAMLLPGGVTGLAGRVGVMLPGGGTRTVTLIVSLRLFSKAGFGATAGGATSQYQTVVFNTAAAGSYFDAAVAFGSLSGLGGENVDRWIEVGLWQASDPPAATAYRALFLTLWPTSESNQTLSASLGPALAQVEGTEVLAPGYLVEKWVRRGRMLLDGLVYGTLGQVPGRQASEGNADAPDKTSPWFKLITGQHQHTGKSEGDGAVLRYPLFGMSYGVDFGDDVSGNVGSSPYRGQKIDPTGSGTGSFNFLTQFIQRISIAKGCRGLDVYFACLPGHTSPEGRLYVYARCTRVVDNAVGGQSTDIITNLIANQGASVGLPTRILGYRGVEVRPTNTAGYQQNRQREVLGYHGHWTGDAELPDTQMPTEVNVNNLYRISDVLRIEIAPTVTDDYNLELRFALSNQAGAWVSAARLQWLAVAPSQGF